MSLCDTASMIHLSDQWQPKKASLEAWSRSCSNASQRAPRFREDSCDQGVRAFGHWANTNPDAIKGNLEYPASVAEVEMTPPESAYKVRDGHDGAGQENFVAGTR